MRNALVTRRLAKVSMTSPIIIDLTGWRNKVFFCSVVGKFEYRKKFDVNVCKQISSLYVNGKPEDVLKLKLLVAGATSMLWSPHFIDHTSCWNIFGLTIKILKYWSKWSSGDSHRYFCFPLVNKEIMKPLLCGHCRYLLHMIEVNRWSTTEEKEYLAFLTHY